MRILCLTSLRGSIASVRPEAEWFIGLKRETNDVTVMAEPDTAYAQRLRDAGVRLVDFDTRGKFDRHAIAQIRHEARQSDIVFAMNNKAIANAVFALRGLPAKLVTYRGQTGNISRWNPGCYLTHLNPRVDKIVCVAEAVRLSLLKQLRNPGKAVTIYKGHDLDWYNVDPVPRAELDIPDDAILVVCVSNYRPRKGIESLVDSFEHIESDAHLMLIGTGMDDPALTSRALKTIDRSRLHTFGFRQDALALTAAADIAVLPALRREGLPKTVIEAMACGVPTVVTDTGGNAELVVDGKCGFVVAPGDAVEIGAAIQRLCDDPGLRRRFGVSGRARIGSRFNDRDTVTRTLAVFQELLDR